MEHNTDRILWTVLILAIGVALYIGFRPATNGLLHQGVEKIQTVTASVNSNPSDSSSTNSSSSSSNSSTNPTVGPNLLINTSSSATNSQTTMQGTSTQIFGVYSRTNSYEQVTAPSSGEFFYRPMIPDWANLYGLTPGATYTLSGSASHTSGDLVFRSEYSTTGTQYAGGDITSLGIPVSDGSVFTPFSHTFTVPIGSTGFYFSLQNYDYTTGSLFRFKNMKLVKD